MIKLKTKPATVMPKPKKIKVSIALPPSANPIAKHLEPKPDWATIRNQAGDIIQLDDDQIKAVELAIKGESFALIGSAGTGKTTTVQAIILALLDAHANRIHQTEFRIKGEGKMVPGLSVGIVSFANRAANNIRNKAQAHPDLAPIINYNCTTLHNMLEYTVEFYYDPETDKNKRRYFPQRDELNKLDLSHLIVEESSQIGVGDNSIWDQMQRALPEGCQVIFLGDVNQLPPVGGKPVLAYAMRDLPTIELRTIHRQALENPIIRQAQNCLSGNPVERDFIDDSGQGVRVFNPENARKSYKGTKLAAYQYRNALFALLRGQIKAGQFDPFQDVVLSPNVTQKDNVVSTKDINAEIAWIMAKRDNREVFEILAGFNKVYVGVGDKVMVDKYEGIVTSIRSNARYYGRVPKPSSTGMDYHGIIHHADDSWLEEDEASDFSNLDLDALTRESMEDDAATRASSHVVEVKLDNDDIVTLSSAGDFGDTNFSLGYAITVHKAQGSEWRNVMVALHDSAMMLLFRELLYTGMTRAVERLDIVAQPHILDKAIRKPRIKGDSMQDKIEFLNSGYLDLEIKLTPNEGEL